MRDSNYSMSSITGETRLDTRTSTPLSLGAAPTLRLHDVNGWRRACDQLARAFDKVTRSHLKALMGSPPW